MRTIKHKHSSILQFFILVLFWVTTSSAYSLTPTPQQIEMFQNLSPEQQRALASQYGIDLDKLNLSNTPAQPELQPEIRNERPQRKNRSMFEEQNLTTEQEQAEETSLSDDEPDAEQLEQFGYDLFADTPDAFIPADNIPPPDNYVLGPGDNLVVQLYGKENTSYNLTVNRDGQIQLPEIGPINLAGLSFNDARELLMNTVQQQMIGVKSSVTVGTLRSIRIFVLGEALQPGSYTVSALSTMTNALFASGGVSNIGSLRNIQLKRKGALVTTLDLYDLLLRGDTSKDARLLPGDVIFIPPIGKTVGVKGEVKRPAIYELNQEKTAIEAIQLAGGFTPNAYPSASRIQSINQNGDRTLLNANLSQTSGQNIRVNDADVIEVYSVLETMEGIVTLRGHIKRPGDVAWRQGLRVTDLIQSAEALLPYPDMNIALIERETQPTREKSVLIVNLGEALKNPSGPQNVALKAKDTLYIFDFEEPRSEILEELVERLKIQASKSLRKQTVWVTGHVRFPGEYPLSPKMTAQDAVTLAGGLTENAYGLQGEITRITYSESEEQSINHVAVNLADNSNQALQAEDQLHIKRLPNWLDQEVVSIEGEVRFPGNYKIKRGETLSELIKRAGGLNDWSYAEGAVFTRDELRVLEAERLSDLRSKLEADIAAANLEQQTVEQKVAVGDAEELLKSLNAVRPLGRMVIDLQSVVEGKSETIQLKDGDKLFVPRRKQAVTVVGEVQFPTSHIFESGLDAAGYIKRSGGTTQKADDERIYVVKANGRVFLPEQSGWFRSGRYKIEAGDTVVVPLDADRIKPLTLWTSVSQIFYQIALGAAAVASF